jgi:glycosyltransferase involved in cell wall biosynthesis
LFTANVSLSDWKKNGIINREISLYSKLQKKHRYTFLTYGDNNDYKFLENSNFNVIPIFSGGKKYLKIIRFFYPVYFVIKNIKNFKKFDLIKSNQLLGAHLGILIKIIYKCKFICRMGYDPNFFYSQKKKKLFIIFLLKIYSLVIYYFSDKIIVTTKEMKRFLINNFYQKEKKIYINPNYVDTSLFSNKPSSKKTIKKFVTVARFDDQKNLSFLFREIKIANCRLDVIGPKNDSYKFFNLTKKISKPTKIRFLGTMDNRSLSNEYKKYDAFILLSKYEGNPKALLEAMSSGMLIVASNVSGINNIIVNNKNGFLISFKEGELFSLINDVNKGNYDLKKIRINAKKFILNNHSLIQIAKNEDSIYRSVFRV